MMEPTQQDIQTANIEMITGALVGTFYYAMNGFFWEDNTVTQAIITGYEGFAGTNYWKFATWVKYYGGLAIMSTALTSSLISMFVSASFNLDVWYYVVGWGT